MSSPDIVPLHELARWHGLETSYRDGLGVLREPPPETLLVVLRVLGVVIESLSEAAELLRLHRQERWRAFADPVLVTWDEEPPRCRLRIPAALSGRPLEATLRLESGREQQQSCSPDQMPLLAAERVEGEDYQERELYLPGTPAPGYHRLQLSLGPLQQDSLLMVAPRRTWHPPGERRSWGLFAPLYALHSERSWGAGDFSDLQRFAEWVAGQGGALTATLPLLSTFLDFPFDPSPYAPVSRFFWNEFYIDPQRTSEWDRCPGARRLFESPSFQERLTVLRESPLIDYRQQMKLKREILEELALLFFEQTVPQSAECRSFLSCRRLEAYARFRATVEARGESWRQWPERLRRGQLEQGDYSERSRRYHLYVQWTAGRQLQSLLRGDSTRTQLYLDLPLGVHPDGFDVWSQQPLFASGVSGGAPPDGFFVQGQNWGFPPIHPQETRRRQHRYLRRSLQHLMRHCHVLRIDHVMNFHRLFWIPRGAAATDGVYVRYPAEDLYALALLESHRQQCLLVGEDLGTVPETVRESMANHELYGMYVAQFEVNHNPKQPVSCVPSRVVASLNTHDTPTFASFWRAGDIDDRLSLNLLDADEAEREREGRAQIREALIQFFQGNPEDPEIEAHLLRRLLLHLSASPAPLLLINLEDLWLEPQPQNVPGTAGERPNWRRKTAYAMEAFCKMPALLDTLQEIAGRRNDRAHE